MADNALLSRLQDMYASGKRLSTSKKYAKLYNQYNDSGGSTGLIQQMGATPQSASAEATEADYLSRYTSAIGAQPTAQDVYSRLSSEQGLAPAQSLYSGLQKRALDVEGQLQGLPEQMSGETRGFDVNATQRAKMEAMRGSDLTNDLTQTARAASRAGIDTQSIQGNIANLMGLEMGQQEKELVPFGVEATMISERLARDFSSYTMDKQFEFETMIAELNQGYAVDNAKLAQMNQLAQMENAYEDKLAYYQATGGNSGGGVTYQI